jgi:glutathione S-transferase
MDLACYHSPGSCSRVMLVALEHIGVPFTEHALALMQGDQRSAAFLAINPKGKVPVLRVDGVPITETPAIVAFLARSFPTAHLLPSAATAAGDLRGLSDLIWCAGVLHPMAHRFFRPTAYSAATPEDVKVTAAEQLRREAEQFATRLAQRPWWYGETWSAVDVYVGWVFTMAERLGLDLADVPAIAAHRARVEAQPAFQRALHREREAITRQDIQLPPGMTI